VVTLHDLNHLDVAENSTAAKRWYYNTVMMRGVRRAARVLTVSEFSRERIIDWSGVSADRVINVGNGVGGAYVPSGDAYDPGFSYVLYVGNRRPHKNLGRLMAAYRRSGVAPAVRLVMTGPFDRNVERLVEKEGIRGRCVCLGAVPEERMPALYRGARAVVLPSLYEGFGLPVVEGMACGVPVITSNCTGMAEVAGDAALLVDPRSTESIADGLATIITDSGLRERLVRRGIARAGGFSWDRTGGDVATVLCEVAREE